MYCTCRLFVVQWFIYLAVHTSGAGEDYVSVSQNLTFGPDATQNCLLVLLVQDGVCEANMTESFEVRLMDSENGATIQDRAYVVIYDAAECSECAQ